MNSKRVWLSVCFFFCIYNLKLLLDEKYDINYVLVEPGDELYDDTTNYLVCTPFDDIKSENRLDFEPRNVSISEFLNHSILSIESRLNISNYFKLEQSYVFGGRICFSIDENDLEQETSLWKYMKIYKIYLYIFSDGRHPFAYEYLYRKKDSIASFKLRINRVKVYTSKLLDSNCFYYNDQRLADRSHCLNKCYKQVEKSEFCSFCFYFHNETVTLNLDLISQRDSKLNQTQRNSDGQSTKYRVCIDKCLETSCFMEIYATSEIRQSYYKKFPQDYEKKLTFRNYIYKPYYSTTYYYLQFIGLIILFTSTSVLEITSVLLIVLAKKTKLITNKYFKLIFPRFKFILTLLCSLFFFIESFLMYTDYEFRSSYPNETFIYNYSTESEPVSIVICFPIETLILNDTNITDGRNSELISSNTFEEIEKQTNRTFETKIKNFSIFIEEIENPLFYTVSDEVLFKGCVFKNQSVLTRCFRFEIEINVPRYQNIMPILFLKLEFNDQFWKSYLIDQNQEFKSKLIETKGKYSI